MGSQENQIKRRSKRRVKEGREREREKGAGGKERKKGEEERRGRKEIQELMSPASNTSQLNLASHPSPPSLFKDVGRARGAI